MGDLLFHRTLVEFLQGLEVCFPDHQGVKETSAMLSTVPANGMIDSMLASGWHDATVGAKDAIFAHDANTVVEAFEKSDVDMLKKVDIRQILLPEEPHDAETMTNIWLFITTLTSISAQYATGTQAPANTHMTAPKHMPAPGERPVPQNSAAAAKKPDINTLVQGFTSAMPQVVKSLNDVLKSTDGEENPLGDLIRGMMGGQQDLRPGMAGNIMQNMVGGDDDSVMQQAGMESGLTVEEITKKLQRLEQYERLRAAKKKSRNGN